MGFQDDHIKSYKIHLGSRSPRREQLLRGLGLDFEIWIKEESEENYPDGLGPAEVAIYLARSKADLYLSDLVDRDILITADTIVAIDDEILHKPDSRAHAISSLKKLMGREHIVITGTCLSSNDKCSCFCSETGVKFASLDDAEIDYYVDK